MGGGIALQIAIRHPDLVRKLVVAAANYDPDGYYPEVLEGIQDLKPEDFAGSPWLEAYTRVAPNPDDWPALLAKIKDLDLWFEGWPREDIASIAAPALVIVGDSDVVRPEHAVEMFRLLGGGVPGDLAGLPRSRLAVLPGTTHVTLVDRADWLTSMVTRVSRRAHAKGEVSAGEPNQGNPSACLSSSISTRFRPSARRR